VEATPSTRPPKCRSGAPQSRPTRRLVWFLVWWAFLLKVVELVGGLVGWFPCINGAALLHYSVLYAIRADPISSTRIVVRKARPLPTLTVAE
jgi:hypothetical protein